MARKIEQGETLSGIAAQNNTTVDELMKLNPNITNPNIIRAGEYINLPGDSASASAGSERLSNGATQNTTLKSNISGISDERYTQLNQKITDDAAYQNATQMIQQAMDALKGGTKYQQQLDDIVNQMMNREKFSYDFSQDPMFMNMLSSYQNQGKLAMQDTMAQASSLTGGYGNTWAQTAGQQAYNEHVQQAYDNLPAYYQLALDSYNLEGDELQKRYSMLSDLDKTEYDKLMDQYGMGQDAANRAIQEFESIMSGNKYLADLEMADWQYKDNKATAAAKAYASAAADDKDNEIKTLANSMKAALDRGGEEALYAFLENYNGTATTEEIDYALQLLGVRSDFAAWYEPSNNFDKIVNEISAMMRNPNLTARKQQELLKKEVEKYKGTSAYNALKQYYGL